MTKITYGEAFTQVKMSMKMVNGKWTTRVVPVHLARMNREDAVEYYNDKLDVYWDKMLSVEIKDKIKRNRMIKMIKTNSLKYRLFCFSLKKK